MDNYQGYLAENILTEDKVVRVSPPLLFNMLCCAVNSHSSDHIPAAQSRAQDSCKHGQAVCLSCTLPVHESHLKPSRMLFDFHKSQNEKKPGSVYATYLVYGIKSSNQARTRVGEDGDVDMTSSIPDTDSVAEIVPAYTMSLVQEDKLKGELIEHVSESR
jgi:hypothetical protein